MHKAIVCSRSVFFARACDVGMKESHEGEDILWSIQVTAEPVADHLGVIWLNGDEPSVVEAMLYYLYHFNFVDSDFAPATIPPIVFNVRVHSIADKYDIPDLGKLAADKFLVRCRAEWKTAEFAKAVEEV